MTRAVALLERLDSLLLYGLALGASLLGVWIVVPVLRYTSFVQVSLAAICIGFALSYLLSRPGFPRPWLARVIAGGAAALAAWQWVSALVFDYWRGGGLWLTLDHAVMVALIGVMVVRAYTLFTRNSLLFCVLPPVAIYGLMASNLISEQIIWGFLGVLFAGVQLAGLDYYLSQREATRTQAGRGLGGHLLVVTTMFAVLLVLGGIVTAAIYLLGQRYRPPISAIVGHTPLPSMLSRVRGGSFLDWLYRFQVATGPVDLSADEVLLLRSPKPLYLRARVYDHFTGMAWSSSALAHEPSRPFLGAGPDLSEALRAQGAEAVEYEIELKEPSNVVYHAAQVLEVGQWVLPEGQAPPAVTVDVVGSVLPAETLPAGTRYRAASAFRGFTAAQDHETPEMPPDFRAAHLGYPGTSRPVAERARELTRNASSLEDKLVILIQWVGLHGGYSTEADAYPAGEDVAAYFVENGGDAYCDVFATVFTVMARGIGVPARLITGFKAETLDSEQDAYVVRGTDAHAWTEVYLPDQGWVIIDATPSEWVEVEVTRWWERIFGGGAAMRNLGLLVGLVALVALILVVGQVSGRLRLPGLPRGPRPGAGARATIIYHYDRACRLVGRLGLVRRPAQTPAEYLSDLGVVASGFGIEAALPVLESLTDRFQRVRYGPHGPTDDDLAEAGREVQRLRRALRRRKKGKQRARPSAPQESS